MNGERIRLGPHLFQSSLGFLNRFAQVFEGVLEPTCSHNVQPNISTEKGQFCSETGPPPRACFFHPSGPSGQTFNMHDTLVLGDVASTFVE